ncbi:MAG: oxygen-independent coproporphyrinogen III oxidase [Bdellovibrionales bacterium]|nr:oxygen-independent coproporphyrinogen III oxidase [Bdellovibrionales bacterium]
MNFSLLTKKYDVPAPRYTSYPTVPYWENSPTTTQWIHSIRKTLQTSKNPGWSLYVHIPFCESLCTFCGCNNSITRNHAVETPYVEQVLAEWAQYLKEVPELRTQPLQVLHLGGGTPTFLSPQSLKQLLTPILESTRREASFEGSVEVDPRKTTREHLELLRSLGFNRISLGVQDLDPEVQRVIHRNQTLEQTLAITQIARELGYESVNWDLIYGLPLQTLEKIERTAEATLAAKPDRIALYSFALVPWIKPQQRIFKDSDLPVGAEKRALYEKARSLLMERGGYREIGMDHFALPSDGLSQSMDSGRLHRNFMGYVDQRTDLLLGLGVSAISETPECFHQNEKVLNLYSQRTQQGEIPTHRGHLLTDEDRQAREQILKLMTQWKVEISDSNEQKVIREMLSEMITDRLVEIDGSNLRILPEGKPFLRNACMALDRRLRAKQPHARVFSQAL